MEGASNVTELKKKAMAYLCAQYGKETVRIDVRNNSVHNGSGELRSQFIGVVQADTRCYISGELGTPEGYYQRPEGRPYTPHED